MQMWGGGSPPFALDPARFSALFVAYDGPPVPNPPPYQVNVTLPAELLGQTVSLLRDGQVIGKAVIGPDGVAKIPAAFGDGSVKPGDLQVAIEPEGGPAVTKQVDGIPQPQPQPPPPEPVSTSLTATCPDDVFNNEPATVTGKLSPGFAGATVKVTVSRPDNRGTFDRTATTDAGGNWSIIIDTSADDPSGGDDDGTWGVQASYAGDADHTASSAPACTFREFGS
jgi:hypothetical protein